MRFHGSVISFSTIVIILLLLVRAYGQAPSSPPTTPPVTSPTGGVPPHVLPAPAPLTDSERIHLRTAQVRSLRAQSLRVCTTIGELTQAPEYQEAQAADAEFRKAIAAIYTSRHIEETDAVLCDGPGSGAAANPSCAGLQKDVLEIRAKVGK